MSLLARDLSLGQKYEGGPTTEKWGYERGTELASRPGADPGATRLEAFSMERALEQPQSLHVAQPPVRGDRIHFEQDGQLGLMRPALLQPDSMSTNRDFCVSEGKKDAFSELDGMSLGCFGMVLFQQLLEVLPLRSQPMGRRFPRSFFPLPSSRSLLESRMPDLNENEVSWLACVCVSLNSYWGCDVLCDELPNRAQQDCLGDLARDVKRLCSLGSSVEAVVWEDFFKVKTVDYQGEEVKVARWFTWDNVAPALPREVGTVPLAEVCELGCKFYVENFEAYLKPRAEWIPTKPPRVMVDDSSWGRVCHGLVESGVCCFLEESEVFMVDDEPLLNGLFGVSKEETSADGHEVYRLIMNLIPLNNICMPISGDVDTLPSWGSMSPYFLQPGEGLLVSSEDVKCFFYTMRVPEAWFKFLAFNKKVPDHVLPERLRGRPCYLASRVLPMGFLNSVSLAQHVHRNLVSSSCKRQSDEGREVCNAPEQELRKDRPFPMSNPLWRVYLDNYDLLERVQATNMVPMEGSLAPGILALRQEYERWDIPRNIKKAVSRSARCELQGATVDGAEGVAFPREAKLCKYFGLALSLSRLAFANQKQWQVACGGLVYFSMFRRPLLGSLNSVWSHIQSFGDEPWTSRRTPTDCKMELLRFLGMMPLARLDFRLDMHAQVTCSDASMFGGGVCASVGTTPIGRTVAQGGLRGQWPEHGPEVGILAIGLFDGIGALRVALELLGIPVVGYISVEKHEPARRVVESHYPGTLHYEDVKLIDAQDIKTWSARFSQVSLVVIGAGPPCQGVSGLNSDRKGALKDERSCLFVEVPRIRDEVKLHFKWCPVYTIMESVASMDKEDMDVMSDSIGVQPLKCDAGAFTWCHRPRLYWCEWELHECEGFSLEQSSHGKPKLLTLTGNQDLSLVVRAGG